jgi:phosphomannomutase/phosphoglucomutase
MSHVFREYDIRGVADRDLPSELVRLIGRGLAKLLRPDAAPNEAPKLVVGRDCRRSTPRLYEALLEGLVTGGAEVTDIGVGPTPLVYFGVNYLDADGGVMITGSHNPGEDNGFKIMRGKAPFFGADIQQLREMIETGQIATDPRGAVQTMPIDDAYLERLRDGVHLDDVNFKVVVDAGNGAAGPLGLRALRAVGLDPIALYCTMDGSFPNHHPDPTVPKNLETLIETVRRENARVGIAWDGDGDRLGVIDADGEPVWGDRLLALFARYLLRERPGSSVIGEVKCSQAAFDDIERHGGKPIMWKTGHSLIKTKMKQEHALLAGEMSGHFFFADRYFGYDDAIYAALRLCEILSRERRGVSELLSDLPRGFSTPEIRVDCPDELKFDVVERVREKLSASGRLTTIDGVRVSWDDGAWALVRASNTGPILVLRFEGPTERRLDEVQREVESAVHDARRELDSRVPG